MHAPPISLGRNGKLGGLPSGGSQDRLWTFGDLSDIAAQLVFQSVFVSEAIEAVRRWVLRSGKHNQDRVPVVGAIAPSPAEDTIAVLPHHPEATIPANVEPRGSVHPADSTVRPAIALSRD